MIPTPSSTELRLGVRARLLLAALALLGACGGGGGNPGLPLPDPLPGPTPATVAVSGFSPVVPACNGGNSSGTLFAEAEVEPFAAIAPGNANLILSAWQQDRASNGGARALVSAVSVDGGRNWARTLHPMSRCGGAAPGAVGDFERASDPWVDIGPDGAAYMMGLAFSGGSFVAGSSSAMLVSRSADGGRNWGPPQSLQRDGDQFFNDKNTLTADVTDGRFVYAIWDRLDTAGNGPALMARSTNAGLSWEPTRAIYTPVAAGGVSQTIGNRIVVLSDGPQRGTLVNVFVQIDSTGGSSSSRVRVIRSTDKGLSWGAPITVADHRSVGTRDPDTGTQIRDGAIVPNIATGAGGTLWLAWQDARFSGGVRDAIALSRSTDGGLTWSAPVAVNKDPNVPAFTPTLAVRGDGSVGLMHYDLRSNTASAATLLADLWLITSRDGLSWSETALRRSADMLFAPPVNAGLFLGDYHGLVVSGTTFIPVVAVPGSNTANRSDIVSMRIDPVVSTQQQALGSASAVRSASAAHLARAAQPVPAGLSDGDFARAHSDAVRRAMEWRVPGWAARVDSVPR